MSTNDIGGKVGTALASIGSFIASYELSDIIFNELVRLISSCTIAAVGALIGYKVTAYLKKLDERRKQREQDHHNINPGSKPPKP
jgi:7-keto-8-aminopelargonate synthetase-like enzyme